MTRVIFDAIGNQALADIAKMNLIVNPFMERNIYTDALFTASGSYVADQWILYHVLSCNLQRIPYPFPDFPGIKYGLRYTVTAAKPSLAAGDYGMIATPIEGYFMQDLRYANADAVTSCLAFVIRTSVAGVYSFSLRNTALNRSFVFSRNLPANTDVLVKQVIPGDITGSWVTTTTKALELGIVAACGTTSQTPTLNQWQAGNFIADTNQVNLHATNGAQLTVGGFVWIPGTDLPNKEQWPYLRPAFWDDVENCRRYAQHVQYSQRVWSTGSGTVLWDTIYYPTPMRNTPTETFVSRGSIGSAVSTINFYPGTNEYGVGQLVSNAVGDLFTDVERRFLLSRL